MKIFQIGIRCSDTSGNSDTYHLKYVKAESLAEVERVFPRGFLSSFDISEITVEPLPATVQNVKDHRTRWMR